MVHREAVHTVLSSFDKLGVKYSTVSREDLDRQHLEVRYLRVDNPNHL